MSEADELFKEKAEAGIPRDRWKRPKIVPPDSDPHEPDALVPYTRISTMAKALDDSYGLQRWSNRMVAKGVAISPDLIAALAAIPDVNADKDTKEQVEEIVEQAKDRAKANARRLIGTAIHSFTDQLDRGVTPEHVPSEIKPDLRAYLAATRGIEWLAFEQFVVVDEQKVAGTMDRLGKRPGARPRVFDIKTGSVADYNALSFACQLAMYAHGVRYSADGVRRPWPGPIDLEVGEIIHIDQGKGRVELYEVDLVKGWAAVELALAVREARKDKNLMRVRPAPAPTVMQQLSACTSLEELRAVYAATGSGWGEKEKKFADVMAKDIRSRA